MVQLGHESVLEGTREALRTPLGLRRAGEDLGDPQFLHRPRELGRRTLGAASGRGQEDAVAVGVERQRESAATRDLLHQGEVAARVLGRPEQRVGHIAGRVVDREQQGEARTALLQPGVMAAVNLEQHPLARHPRAPHAVLRRLSPAGTGHTGLLQDPPDREAAQVEPLVLPEQFAQMNLSQISPILRP